MEMRMNEIGKKERYGIDRMCQKVQKDVAYIVVLELMATKLMQMKNV